VAGDYLMMEKELMEAFTICEPITKGWSEDKKFCVTKADGTKYLLRITPFRVMKYGNLYLR